MHVQVRNFLAGVEAGVGKQPVPALNEPCFTCNSPDCAHKSGDFGLRGMFSEVVPGDVAALGNHQNVGRGKRADVVESQHVLVLEVVEAPAGTLWHLQRHGSTWQALLRLPARPEPTNARLRVHLWAVPRNDPAVLKELLATP